MEVIAGKQVVCGLCNMFMVQKKQNFKTKLEKNTDFVAISFLDSRSQGEH